MHGSTTNGFHRLTHSSRPGLQNGNRFVVLLGVLVLSITLTIVANANEISTPHQASVLGLDSLRHAVLKDGGIPLPDNLSAYVKNRDAALQLGKAFFWDMQVGSDGVQACASCHFHAGADNRNRNQLNPNLLTFIDKRKDDVQGYFTASRASDIHFETKQPNERLTRNDFPFVKSIQLLRLNANGTWAPGLDNSNDIASSMGMFFTQFDGVRAGFPIDAGTPIFDPVWNVSGRTPVRRVEPRNTPSVINAVFNFTNFWDGRANPHFNGQNAFGDQDQSAAILVNWPNEGLAFEQISIGNASLASQAVSPLTSFSEMSFGDPAHGNARSLPEIGQKLLGLDPNTGRALIPLGQQKVHRHDSLLGSLSRAPMNGLSSTYVSLIQRAFTDKYWNSTEPLDAGNGLVFTQMEANFGLFFGLSVALYESTLVADQTPFDQWMETGRFNRGFGKKQLAGLNLFANQGQCITCHGGPELTNASVRKAKQGSQAIRAMTMAEGAAFYDNGFYNISVTPTTDDIGRGDRDGFGFPLSFARQALFSRLKVSDIPFAILGNNNVPAVDEDSGVPTCDDNNGNKVCDPGQSEALRPDFQRVAVDGAFKTPGLRNVELTGPYFHNGGMATLRQVVQFYNRGGNFCNFNIKDLDPNIQPLGLSTEQENQLVSFLVALTDARVRYQSAPFDHPELRVPINGFDTSGVGQIEAVGAYGSHHALSTFLHLSPHDAIFTPDGTCASNLP